jgi:ABC-2 type transport system ATP-binding protein
MIAGNGITDVAALEVAHVSHAYGAKAALSDVSFSIPQASFTVLLGLNGAGKTTLFSLVSHLYPIWRGTIRVHGHDVERTPSMALRRLGIVFQARTLDLDLSVFQNLSYHASLHGLAMSDTRMSIEALLRSLDLAGRAHDKVRSLSGGQMRRIEIARALLHSPRLLLLDEATVGLDIRSRADILARIRDLVSTKGISVLWATHLIDEVREDDSTVVLHQGRVAGFATASELLEKTGAGSIHDAFARLSGLASTAKEETTSWNGVLH